MIAWSNTPNYSSGPDTGFPTKTAPNYTSMTAGVPVGAQEMNYLLNRSDVRLAQALAESAQNWTFRVPASAAGGHNAFMSAFFLDFRNQNKWLIAAGDASGSGSSAFLSEGLGDPDFVDVSTTPISGGFIYDLSFDPNDSPPSYWAAFLDSGFTGMAVYSCSSAPSSLWTTRLTVGVPVNDVKLHYFSGALYAAFITSGLVTISYTTDHGVTFLTGLNTSTGGTAVQMVDNGAQLLVMTSDGQYWIGTTNSWTHFANPFGAGNGPIGLAYSAAMGAYFALTLNAGTTSVWRSTDGLAWVQQVTLPFLATGIATAGPGGLVVSAGLQNTQVYFSVDEGVSFYTAGALVTSPVSPVIVPRVFSSGFGYCSLGQSTLRFSRRLGLPLDRFA